MSGSTAPQAVTGYLDANGNFVQYGAAGSAVTISGGTVTIGGGSVTALPSGTTTVTGSVTVSGTDTVTVGSAVTPYALPANQWRGSGTSTTTGAVTLHAGGGASVKTYITDLELSNTGTVTTVVTFNDDSTAVFIVPAGGGSNKTFNTPLATAANTAPTFTPAAGSSTIYVNAQGFFGP